MVGLEFRNGFEFDCWLNYASCWRLHVGFSREATRNLSPWPILGAQVIGKLGVLSS